MPIFIRCFFIEFQFPLAEVKIIEVKFLLASRYDGQFILFEFICIGKDLYL